MFGGKKQEEVERELIRREQAVEMEELRLAAEKERIGDSWEEVKAAAEAAMRMTAEVEAEKAVLVEEKNHLAGANDLVRERLSTIGIILRRLFTGELDGDPSESARAMLEYLGTLPDAPVGLADDLDEKVKMIVEASTLSRLNGSLQQICIAVEAARKAMDHKSRQLDVLLAQKREQNNLYKNAVADKATAEERARSAETERDTAVEELNRLREERDRITDQINEVRLAVTNLLDSQKKVQADLSAEKIRLAELQKSCDEVTKIAKADLIVSEKQRDAALAVLRSKVQAAQTALAAEEQISRERIEAAEKAAEDMRTEAMRAIEGVASDLQGETESHVALLKGLAGGIKAATTSRLTEPFFGPPPEPEDPPPSAEGAE